MRQQYSPFFMQGKGYPDVNTRRFLRRLWDELQLPPLGLMDSDPHGISIFLVYRFGSQVYIRHCTATHRSTLCDRCWIFIAFVFAFLRCIPFQNLEDMEHLATPQLRYIGLQPRDVGRLRLPDDARLPLTQRDRSLIDSLSARPFVIQQPLLLQQVGRFLLFSSLSLLFSTERDLAAYSADCTSPGSLFSSPRAVLWSIWNAALAFFFFFDAL